MFWRNISNILSQYLHTCVYNVHKSCVVFLLIFVFVLAVNTNMTFLYSVWSSLSLWNKYLLFPLIVDIIVFILPFQHRWVCNDLKNEQSCYLWCSYLYLIHTYFYSSLYYAYIILFHTHNKVFCTFALLFSLAVQCKDICQMPNYSSL